MNELNFIFDLHGVIFRLSKIEILKELIKSPHKIKLAQTLFFPRAIYKTYSSLKNGAIAEETLLQLKNDFPQFEELVETGFQIINAQKPIWPTIELVRNLKINGHKVYIFSNIGEQSMDILQNKFPDILGYFDGILSSSSKDNFLKKPSPKAFEKCLNFFNINKSTIVFIDDKTINIESAHKLGIQAILFKNAYDVTLKLKNLKYLSL